MDLATITHKLMLSTTEDNLVGEVKVRQADDETQLFEVTVLENGTIKNFAGLKPFFCLMAREITGQGVSEEPVTAYDDTKGTLKYTLSANAMQMVGRNEAYFSFRKELSNGEWIEQFSTRSFFYTVEKSIYTQPFKDSNYWWTFKELYRKFLDYQDSGKISWEEFVEQNKDIIESVDPGGLLLSKIGIFDSFRDFDISVMDKIKNEFTERAFNVRWCGMVPDKTTDYTTELNQFMADNSKVDEVTTFFFPKGTYLIDPTKRIHPPNNSKLLFESGAVLSLKQTNKDIYAGIDVINKHNIEIINAHIVGDKYENTMITEGAAHGIFINGSDNIRIRDCFIEKCFTDGVYIRGGENIVVENTVCDDNRRQGFSITAGKNITLLNCKASNTDGTAPQMGLDIEPNFANDILYNVKIINFSSENNSGPGIGINYSTLNDLAKAMNIEILNHFDEGSYNGFSVTNTTGIVSDASIIKNIDPIYKDNKACGINIVGHKSDDSAEINIIRPKIINPNVSNGTNERSENVGISVNAEISTYPSGVSHGNVKIIEPSIKMIGSRVLKRGIYLGYGAPFKNILIVNPLEIKINDIANLSNAANHELLSFNGTGTAKVIDDYDALTLRSTANSINNYSTAVYSRFISTSTDATSILNFIKFNTIENFYIEKQGGSGKELIVHLPTSVKFFLPNGESVTGTLTTTLDSATLKFSKMRENVYMIQKYLTWT
ncbi:BppU family phage baseplate upper protein [Enterococcus casseliflavus]|nr:BppU family phage baseplate upper protein [Enterococcus casseliflavus]